MSKYLCIDNDAYLDENLYIQNLEKNNTNYDVNELKLKYCPQKDVMRREKEYFMLRSTFFCKQSNLKFKGQRLETMELV
jgi:hypothetical protein